MFLYLLFLNTASIQRANSLVFTHPVQLYDVRLASAEAMKAKSSFQASKWDNLVDEDDEDEVKIKDDGLPVPPRDMEFIPRNIMRQVKNYRAISDVGGADTICDVYVRDPDSSTFWFSGKVARCTGTVSVEQAVQRQWHLIEQHAARLRNVELGPHYGTLEIWVAPGNSELEVAYNRPSIKFVKVDRLSNQDAVSDTTKSVKSAEVGFLGELYEKDEEGFRTERTEDGLPARKEVQGGLHQQSLDGLEQ